MKVSLKLFFYLAIVVIIVILNCLATVQAKPKTNLMEMDEHPEKMPEFESAGSRMRRSLDPRVADEDNVPKGELNSDSHLRNRRQAPPEESDAPKRFQQEIEKLRHKRQMPPPPGEMPMPPM